MTRVFYFCDQKPQWDCSIAVKVWLIKLKFLPTVFQPGPDSQRHEGNCFHCSNCGCLICYNQCEFHDSFSILMFWQCWLWQCRVWHCHSVRRGCSRAVPAGMRNLRSDLGSSCLFRVLTGSSGCRDTQPVEGQEPGNGRAEPSLATRACLVSAWADGETTC